MKVITYDSIVKVKKTNLIVRITGWFDKKFKASDNNVYDINDIVLVN